MSERLHQAGGQLRELSACFFHAPEPGTDTDLVWLPCMERGQQAVRSLLRHPESESGHYFGRAEGRCHTMTKKARLLAAALIAAVILAGSAVSAYADPTLCVTGCS